MRKKKKKKKKAQMQKEMWVSCSKSICLPSAWQRLLDQSTVGLRLWLGKTKCVFFTHVMIQSSFGRELCWGHVLD